MNLTPTQLAALKTDIQNDATFNSVPHTADGAITIAAAYNQVVTSPSTFWVYRTDINPQEIFDQITWANFTPTDPADATVTWSNRSLAAQGKMLNLQTMLIGATIISAARANVRAGLQDALTSLPTGASGASVAAGWVGVRDNVLARAATRIEKLFATNGGLAPHDGSSQQNAQVMAVQGNLSGTDVANAMGW